MGGGWWWWCRDGKELVSKKDAEPGTKQDAVQPTGVSQRLTGGTGKQFWSWLSWGTFGPGTRRPRIHRACGREASGTPRYRLCSDVLDLCERSLPERKWRSRTEIPPSPGKRMYQVPPVSRPAGTGLGPAGGEDEARWPRTLAKLAERRQDAAGTGTKKAGEGRPTAGAGFGATDRIATESARKVALPAMSSVSCSQAKHLRSGLSGACSGEDEGGERLPAG